MKRLLLLFSALMLSIIALWAHDVEIDGIYYNIYEYNNTATVTYKGTFYHDYNEYSGSVTIPKTITYNSQTYSVTSIGYEAFRGCIGLTSVTIGNSVTSIGEEAFRGCSGLISVTIPNSVTSIGSSAFYATKLYDTESNWENGVLYIDNCIIKAKSDVVQGLYSIKEGTKLIASNAFNGCSGLTLVTIPNNVISIGDGAFWGCSGLTSVIIPNSVISIGYNAFSACSGLTSLEIPNSVTSIGGSAFSDCSSLTSVTIPSSVTSIGWGAFNACNGLTIVNYLGNIDNWIEIDFGSNNSNPTYYAKDLYIKGKLLTDVKISSADSIKSYSFNNCASIKSVEIGNNVTYIGFDVFDGTKLYNTESNWEKGFLYFDNCLIKAQSDIVKGSYSIKEGTRLIADGVFASCNDLYSVVIPNSVTSLGNCAFKDCSGLSSVTIPNSVTSIGWSAFEGCSGLTSVTIPNSVTSIGSSAFYGCSGLTSVTIPNSVTSIGSCAFEGCSGLTSVTISNSVTSIGYSAFYGCSGLTLVTIPNNVISIGEGAFYGCSGLTSVTIPNSVTSIGSSAFYGCSGLTSVTIPNSVTSIGSRAFEGCSGLTSVTIPNSVTSIGSSAFYGCSGLSSVTIPNSVTSISSCAFEGCSGLTSVTIPNSVTSIGRSAFEGCSGLTSVTIPNSVTYIGERVFEGTELYNTESNWENGVLYIGNFLIKAKSDVVQGLYSIKENTKLIVGSAFSGCRSLTSVTIPNSVTSIEDDTFYECWNLTSVEIPNSVTSIGKYAFGVSSALTKVNYLGTVDEWAKFDWYHSSYNPTYYANDLYINGELLTDVKITSADSIKQYAFYNCKSIKSVEIGNSVKSICESAFSGCSGLNSVLIGDSVTSIESYAFNGCSNLTSIVIPKNVKSIRYNVFKYCKNLKSIYNCSGVDILVDLETPPILESPGEGKTTLALYIPKSACEEAIPYAIGQMPGDGSWKNQESLKMTRCEGKSRWWQVTVDALTPENATNFKFRMDDGYGGWSFEPKGGRYELLEDAAEYIQIKPDETNNLLAVANCNNKVLYIESRSWSTPCQSDEGDFIMSEFINACPVGDFIVNYEDEIIEYIGDTTVNRIEIPESVKGIDEGVFASCANIDTIVWNAIDCADFTETTAPFNAQAAQIKSVIFGNNVEYIPAYLCSDMTLLTEVSIPSKVNSIGENTFKGCSRLKFITSYPTLVPLAKESSFNSYSAYLYIPCDYYDYYYLDDVFGKFTEIKCISAEEVEGSDKVEIEVDSNNNATIIWPSTGNASSYELVISKNGEVFCTLLFNENGQLTSIDFGNRSASVGFQFTVTGLDAASKYSYSIVAKDEKGNELESYNGTFTTNGYSEVTAILETLADANITISGGLITCSDAEFTIYNTLGQDVTAYNGSLQPGVYVVSIADDVVKVMVK